MAQFDFKNANLYVRDGYANAGAVGAAAAIGATSLTLTGVTGIVGVGATFKVGATDVTKYTVTGHTETSGNTTSITFTPPLVVAATLAEAITFGPHELLVKLGQGNCSYTEKKNRDYTLDRGKLSSVRDGDEVPVEVRLDALWEFLTAATGEPPTLEDAFKHRGPASTWVTSATDPCEPFAVDLVIEYQPPCGNIPWESITLPDFRYEEIAHDMKAGTLAFTGKCNVTEATVARHVAA